MVRGFNACLSVLVCFVATSPVAGLGPSATQEGRLVGLVETASKAVCRVVIYDKHNVPVGHGTGFLLSDGKLVSCHHVIGTPGAVKAEAVFGEAQTVPITGVLAVDADRDLVIARLGSAPRGTNGLALAKLGVPKPGTEVVAIGYPLGLACTISRGLITSLPKGSDLNRSLGTPFWPRPDDRLIQTDAAISQGNSGGPLLGPDGTVLAVVALKHLGGESLNFAIPSPYLRLLIQSAASEAVPLTKLQPSRHDPGQSRPVLPPREAKVSKYEVRRAIGRIIRATKCRRCRGTGTLTKTRLEKTGRGVIRGGKEAGKTTVRCPDCEGRGTVPSETAYELAAELATALAYMETDATTVRPEEIERIEEAATEVLTRLAQFPMPRHVAARSAATVLGANELAGKGVCFRASVLALHSSTQRDYFLVRLHGSHDVHAALVCKRGAVRPSGSCFVAGVVGGRFEDTDGREGVTFVWPSYIEY